MTITQRNSISLLVIILLLLILSVLIFIPFIFAASDSLNIDYADLLTPNYIYAFLLILFSSVSLFTIRLFFYKTNSLEIFFFMLFLSTMIFETSRPLISILQQLNSPSNYIMFFSRTAYFGKICGTTSLFVSALFSSDLETRKLDTPIIIIIVLSFLLSASMPLSDNVLQNSYYKPGFFNYFVLSFLFIDVLTFMVFIINFFQKKSNEYIFLALSILLISSGRELTFYYAKTEFFAAGIAFMISGTILFSNKLHGIYKWY